MRALPLLILLLGCEPSVAPQAPDTAGADASGEPGFPAGYREAFELARPCMHSHEHDLRYVQVYANPEALAPYQALSPETPYPVGAILVKEEYDSAGCEDPLGFTVMRREAPGYAPTTYDWRWQKFDAEQRPLPFEKWQCITCHSTHCDPAHPPGGFELTCASDAAPPR